MVDPGGVVGVISLALQVFQGLTRYYSDFRSFDENIENVLRRAERFSGILAALEGPARKLEIDNNAISEQVRLAITSCETGIARLKIILQKCNEAPLPNTHQSRIQVFKNKTLFPFRKGTLHDAGKCLDSFHASLDTILQTLQIDTVIRFGQQTEERFLSLSEQTNRIQRRQIYQTELLESIEGSSQSHTEMLSLHSLQMQDNVKALSLQIQNLQGQISHSLQTGRFPAPSVIEKGLKSQSELNEHFRRLRRRNRSCSCHSKLADSYIPYFRRFNSYWQRGSVHQKLCPLYRAAEVIDVVGFDITSYGRLISKVFRASLAYQRGAGGISISCSLNAQRYIESHHPSLALFDTDYYGISPAEALWVVSAGGTMEINPNREISQVLSYIQQQMDESFRNGTATPSDITTNGATYLNLACQLLSLTNIRQSYTQEEIRDFLQFFIIAGVPMNSLYSRGRPWYSPLQQIIDQDWTTNPEGQIYLCSYLAELGCLWRLDWSYHNLFQGILPNTTVKWRTLFLAHENLSEAFCGNPIKAAILHCSESGLRREIRESENLLEDPYELIQTLMMSANWSEGLRLLLREFEITDAIELHPILRCAVLISAFKCKNQESVSILLDSGFQVSTFVWHNALLNRDDIELIQEIIDRIPHQSFHGGDSNLDINSIFHFDRMSRDVAIRLFRSGFQDIDVELHGHCERDNFLLLPNIEKPGTPLWSHSFQQLESSFFSSIYDRLDLLRWLVSKGARLDYMQPKAGTTPAHLISATLIGYFADEKGSLAQPAWKVRDMEEFYLMILALDHTDRCNCACTQIQHCYPIASAFKIKLWSRHYERDGIEAPRRTTLKSIIQFTQPVLSKYPHLAIAVTRVLTFEKLGIRHTCHDAAIDRHIQDKHISPMPIPDDEIAELQEEDSDLIDQLNGLMPDFEQEWTIHEGTFQEFIDDVWAPRMEEVLSEMEPITQEDVKAIENIGVVLQRPYGPVLPPGYQRSAREVDSNESG